MVLVGAGLLGLGTAPLWWGAADVCGPGEEAAGEARQLLVELGPDDHIGELSGALSAHGATATRAFPRVSLSEDEDLAQYFVVDCTKDCDGLLERLLADRENVDSAEENVRVEAVPMIPGAPRVGAEGRAPNDPRVKEQWGFEMTNAEDALGQLLQRTPEKVATVAIVDTGVDSRHEDLEGVFLASRGDKDKDGHGTHCAGIAGADTNNGKGVASLNWEGRFIRIRGYDAIPGGWGTAEDVAQGIIDAAEDGADVISLSLGGYSPKPPKVEVDAIEYALSLGAVVVVAAGNSDDDAANYAPANIPGVIVVGALNQKAARRISPTPTTPSSSLSRRRAWTSCPRPPTTATTPGVGRRWRRRWSRGWSG